MSRVLNAAAHGAGSTLVGDWGAGVGGPVADFEETCTTHKCVQRIQRDSTDTQIPPRTRIWSVNFGVTACWGLPPLSREGFHWPTGIYTQPPAA
jgi:hypothetical protein